MLIANIWLELPKFVPHGFGPAKLTLAAMIRINFTFAIFENPNPIFNGQSYF